MAKNRLLVGIALSAALSPLSCERSTEGANGSKPEPQRVVEKERNTSEGKKAAANRGEQQTVKRDPLYHKLLKSEETFQAILKQQPGNKAALQRSAEKIQSDLRELRQGISEQEIKQPPSATPPDTKSGQSKVGPPAKSSPPEEGRPDRAAIEKGKKATLEGTHLPGPPLGKPKKTLAGVPDKWIHDQIDAADNKLKGIIKILGDPRSERKELAGAASELHAIIERMNNPSPSTPPVRPERP